MTYKKTSGHNGVKIKLLAQFENFSKKDFNGKPRSVDLINVKRENGKPICNRISMKHINRFREAGDLKKGDMIAFQGWVMGNSVSNPTRVTIVEKLTTGEMPSVILADCIS
jgi:hypothetical protein